MRNAVVYRMGRIILKVKSESETSKKVQVFDGYRAVHVYYKGVFIETQLNSTRRRVELRRLRRYRHPDGCL